jgi:hypothetical protein
MQWGEKEYGVERDGSQGGIALIDEQLIDLEHLADTYS